MDTSDVEELLQAFRPVWARWLLEMRVLAALQTWDEVGLDRISENARTLWQLLLHALDQEWEESAYIMLWEQAFR